MGGRLTAWPACVLTFAMGLCLAAPAQAAFPGQNGKIAFAALRDGNFDIYGINPDGSGEVRLTSDPAMDRDPAWSPDGTRIAFQSFRSHQQGEIYAMNADGSGQVRLTDNLATGSNGDRDPAWTPDGSRIVFARNVCNPSCDNDLFTMDPDGSDQVELWGDGTGSPSTSSERFPAWAPDGSEILFMCLTGGVGPCWDGAIYIIGADLTNPRRFPDGTSGGGADTDPNWSPDAGRVAYAHDACGSACESAATEIRVVNRYGTGDMVVVASAAFPTNQHPSWSPDGTKLAFARGDVYTINADGSGRTNVTAGAGGFGPDWQPIPINAYPRPAGAYPMRASLVPAYQPCSSPNRTHGPPLGFGSCSPPSQQPGQLTIGTPDANGQGAKSVGSLRVTTLTGNPATPADEADVRVLGKITDVRMRSDLSDYTGDLEARLRIQITDKDNTPHPGGPGAATVQELTLSHQIPCAASADTTIGSTCQLDTTVEALVPGAVKEKRRAIWELDAIRVHDGAGNLFLTQGLFVP